MPKKGMACLACLIAGLITGPPSPAADAPPTLHSIAAGTRLDRLPNATWSHVLVASPPRVTQGDVQELSPLVRGYAEMFALVVLAQLEADPARPQKQRFAKIGIGLAVEREGNWLVVSGPDEGNGGEVEFSLLTDQILQRAASTLQATRVVVWQPTVIIYDSPALLRVDRRNVERVVRTMLWIGGESGNINQVLWTLEPRGDDASVPVWKEGVYVTTPLEAERELYVDADELVLGIPSEKAFALAELPTGLRFPLAGSLAEDALRRRYTPTELKQLARGVIASIRTAAASSRPNTRLQRRAAEGSEASRP